MRNDDHDSNSLDRRLMEAKEEAMRLERMFAENKQGGGRRPHFAMEPERFEQYEEPENRNGYQIR